MKKLAIVSITLILFLSACGSSDLDGFVKNFNKHAKSNGVPELAKDDFGEIEDEDNMSWKNLYESDEYYIEGKYSDGESLSGYYLVIDNEQPYEELDGVGYDAGRTIIQSLGLNEDKYDSEFKKALREGSHTYTDSDYRVSFSYPGKDGLTSVGMIVNFDKK